MPQDQSFCVLSSLAFVACSVIFLQIRKGWNPWADREEDGVGPITASGRCDPGLRDVFHCFALEMKLHGSEKMPNLSTIPNDNVVVGVDPSHPPPKELVKLRSSWKLGDKKRNYVLIVEDMEKEYESLVDYVVPAASRLIAKFRELSLPILWTNWIRKSDDCLYGAVDRFYGPRGVKNGENPCYVAVKDGGCTVDALAPRTEEEKTRWVNSLHLSKFADLDDNGREIIYPMLEAWGVNTIVLMGAWTDDCIAATVFEAVDAYGYDVVLVSDALATATPNGSSMFDCLCASVGTPYTAEEICSILTDAPHLIDRPKAALSGYVYLSKQDFVAVRT